MAAFRCVPIPTATAEQFRRTGTDDRGNRLRRVEALIDSGYPCRHCLRCALPGDPMLLGSYNLPRPNGIYWTPSPMFIHAGDCPRFVGDDEVAPIVSANPMVSVRAYDDDDLCLYDLGQVCAGTRSGAPDASWWR